MNTHRLRRIDFKDAALRQTLYRRRYLIPHAVTLGNMFCGFLAVIYSTSFRFEKAAVAIVLAIVLDGLDGRVARKLNATSKFGVEFDSFSDLVSFGIAPAVLVYNWCFKVPADEFGVLVTFIFALCGASRLARFNIADENLKSFSGLPTPGAAAAVAGLIYCVPDPGISLLWCLVAAILMLSLAFLMVSKIEYMSIKQLRLGNIRAIGKVGLGVLIALIWYNPKIGLLVLGLSYAYSSPIYIAWKRFRGADQAAISKV